MTCIEDFLSLNLKTGIYDARARVLLYELGEILNMPRARLARKEMKVAHQLEQFRDEHKEEVKLLSVVHMPSE